jgi:hypothetical protein
MICGVYAVDTELGRYVGSSTNVVNRWTFHRYHLRRGSHHSSALRTAQSFAFKLLERCIMSTHKGIDHRDCLDFLEQRWMDSTSRLLNSVRLAGKVGNPKSPETRRQMRESALRVASNPAERIRRSERARRQWAIGNIGRKHA